MSHIFTIFAIKIIFLYNTIKPLKYISVFLTIAIITVYLLSLLFRVDAVQHRLALYVANEIKNSYGIPLEIEGMKIHHLDELTLKNVIIRDQSKDTIIQANEVTAHISPSKLAKGEMQINTLIFAEPVIKLNRASDGTPLNIQFIIDNLNSGEKEKQKSLSLRINQLLIYDGTFRYDVHNAERGEEKILDPKHIAIDNFECNISLKKFHRDTLNAQIRSISGRERSGLELKKFRARINATNKDIRIKNFTAELPHSDISSKELRVVFNNGKPVFAGELQGKAIKATDFAAFGIPGIDKIPAITFSLKGEGDSISSTASLSLSALTDEFHLRANSFTTLPYSTGRTISVNISRCDISRSATAIMQSFLADSTYSFADILGNTSITGEFMHRGNSIRGNIKANTACGNLEAGIKTEANGEYTLKLNGQKIDLKRIFKNDKLTTCNLTANANGIIGSSETPISFNGRITELITDKYNYSPIEYNGTYTPEAITANATINDPGLETDIQVEYLKGKEQKISLAMAVDTLIPHRLGLGRKASEQFSFNLDGELNIDEYGKRLINAKFNNIRLYDGEQSEYVRNFHICDNNSGEQRLIIVSSDFLNGSIIGNYSLESIIENLGKMTAKHMPSLGYNLTKAQDGCNYIFKFDIRNSHFISKLFNLPVTIRSASEVSGSCNSERGYFRFDTRFNRIDIGNSFFNTITFDGISDKDRFIIKAQAHKPAARKTGNDIIIGMQCNMLNDTVRSNIYWNNALEKNKMQGSLRMDAHFGRNSEGLPTMDASIRPDSIVHNDSVWYISAGTVAGDLERIAIKNLHLYNSSQHLMIDGLAGNEPSDSLLISANNLEISTILDLVNFRTLRFAGCATGKAIITKALKSPEVFGELGIDSFKVENSYMGNSHIKMNWSSKWKSFFVDANIHNPGKGTSTVSGVLSQANDTICINVNAGGLNMGFLNNKLKNFISDINGTGDGKARIHGSWRKLDISGAIALNCNARIKATNAAYFFTGDTLEFSPEEIRFNSMPIRDRRGNRGVVDGLITHKNLSRWECRLNATINNLLVYDTHGFSAQPFYGTVYATGNASITSDSKGLFLKAELRSDPASRFIYNSSDAGGVRDNSYVTFIDSSKKNTYNKIGSSRRVSTQISNYDSKLNLDFMLDMQETMQLRVYTNIATDDYIDLYGNGFLHAVFDEKDGFSMKGNLDLTRGTYKFTVQNIFPKEFNITKGSTLVFNGNPFDAALNLKTKYLVPSASLGDLTTETAKRKTVKVNCLMDITGTLKNPTLSFDLELPEGSEEERELLASVASTTEQKNMQFIYLLGIGKFYTYDYNNAQAGDNQSSTAMESLISNTLSGQLNNMLGQVIDNGNWDISGNFSTSERGWNSMEVEGMLEGRLLDNRLLINGNFGYRENPTANRNFIGDFEIQWLLNKSGTVSLKAYSKTNDRYFSKTNLTTQGAGIMLRHDFNNWIWWRNSKREKSEEKKESENKN